MTTIARFRTVRVLHEGLKKSVEWGRLQPQKTERQVGITLRRGP